MKKKNLFLKLHIPGLIVGLFITTIAFGQKDTLSILHITDLHIIYDLELYQEDLARNRENNDQEGASFYNFLQIIPQKTKADMIIATGDLLDSYEEEGGDATMLDSSVEQFAASISDYTVPLFLTLGNHDMVSYAWKDDARFSSQYNAGRSRAAWIRNVSCFNNGTYYSQIHEIANTTYRLIFLDNGFLKFSPKENISIPYIDKPQLYWLKEQLQESSEDIEIIFMHVPFSLPGIQAEYSEMYSLITKNPSTRLIVAGHQHKNKLLELPSETGRTISQVQTGALVRNQENWRIIQLTEKNILVSFPGKAEIELTVPITRDALMGNRKLKSIEFIDIASTLCFLDLK
jgi:DNA repair exonuclease SbcCD nuclease subunit